MASQDLINAIASYSAAGESKEKIKEHLISEGWQEQAIDFAFEELKPKTPSFWEQLPTYPYFQALDAKYSQLPPKVIWGISAGLVILVIAIIFIVYLFMDPFALSGTSRDQEREAVYSQLQTALQRYYDQNGQYPPALSELVPQFIKYVPTDPKTRIPYDYSPLGYGAGYNLCIYYETRSFSEGCLNTEVINAQELGIPVPTEKKSNSL